MTGASAAVDVGTNSVRLLVVAADGHRLLREMRITRLGQGVDETGRLDDTALERTLATLRDYRDRWREHAVAPANVRIAATSAIRDAADRARFFAAVADLTGVDAEVLSGDEEARLAYRGATAAVDVALPGVVLDVGGGSTELIVGDGAGEVAGAVSLQLGCVRLTERALRRDPPGTEDLQAARREVRAWLSEGDERLAGQGARVAGAASVIGVAGTVTTLAALHLGLPEYLEERIHATRVPRDAVVELTRELAGMTADERARLGPMAPGREDVIVGGCLVVEGVLDRYGFEELVASEADILDGLAATAGGQRPGTADGRPAQ